MSTKFAIFVLIIISLLNCCWARPKPTTSSSIYNEVTSLQTGEKLNNEILQQLSAIRKSIDGEYYMKRRSYYNPKTLPFMKRIYNMPDIAPGGANYFSNEVMPLSTYEIVEPEAMY